MLNSQLPTRQVDQSRRNQLRAIPSTATKAILIEPITCEDGEEVEERGENGKRRGTRRYQHLRGTYECWRGERVKVSYGKASVRIDELNEMDEDLILC